jgi:hypothetical protein
VSADYRIRWMAASPYDNAYGIIRNGIVIEYTVTKLGARWRVWRLKRGKS